MSDSTVLIVSEPRSNCSRLFSVLECVWSGSCVMLIRQVGNNVWRVRLLWTRRTYRHERSERVDVLKEMMIANDLSSDEVDTNLTIAIEHDVALGHLVGLFSLRIDLASLATLSSSGVVERVDRRL